MQTIQAYSPGHLLVCLGAVLAATLAVSLLRKKNKTRVLFACGIGLALLEILKQILMAHIYSSYSWSDLPFQLCSIPMYLCLLYPIWCKGQRVTELFLRSFGLLGAIAAFAVPYDVLSSHLLLSLQSILWHTVLLFLGFFCTAEPDRSRINGGAVNDTALLYLCLAAAAVGLNALLYRVSGGTANLFFLGPAKPYVPMLDEIRARYGWIAETLAMVLATEAGGLLLLLIEKVAISISNRCVKK